MKCRMDGAEEFLPGGVLEQVAGRASFDSKQYIALGIEGGEDQHAHRRCCVAHLTDDIDATHHRHAQIHECDVHVHLAEVCEGFFAFCRFGDHREMGITSEDAAQPI